MPSSTKPIIGITGGIGAGKSTVARILSQLGCFVVDSDDLARQALLDPVVLETLVLWWGRGILDPQGQIDRRAIAGIVFTRPAERKRLESLVHPWIEKRRLARFKTAPDAAPALVIDAPLLVEAGIDEQCDAVIFVNSDRSVRLDRLTQNRGWSDRELNQREESQLPLDAKRSRADYVIDNDGDLPSLTGRVRQTLHEIVQSHRQ
jgi:dephospho-CoA kinase